MPLNEKLAEQIQKEIRKSGFPLELTVLAALREERCHLLSNIPFVTKDGSIKEIDAVATFFDAGITSARDTVGIVLLIECKTSREKPWVFFEEQWDSLALMGLVSHAKFHTDLIMKDPFTILVGSLNTSLANHHYNQNDLPKSRTYFEAFRDNAGTDIYKAIVNLWHGGQEFRRWIPPLPEKSEYLKPRTLMLHHVIVFDGTLLLASGSGDGDFELTEPRHVLLRTVNTVTDTPNPLRMDVETIVDVVHISHFPEYLKVVNTDLVALRDHLVLIRDSNFLHTEND